MKREGQVRKTNMIYLQCFETPDIANTKIFTWKITLSLETLALNDTSKTSHNPNTSKKLTL